MPFTCGEAPRASGQSGTPPAAFDFDAVAGGVTPRALGMPEALQRRARQTARRQVLRPSWAATFNHVLDAQSVSRYAASMSLSANDIQRAFAVLAEELARENRTAEIVVAGGAALVLLYGARESTKDVDAYFVRPEASVIREAAARAAARLDLPPDWLNDGAKGYFVGLAKGEVLHHSDALTVRAASAEQLLAMKLAAWRDAVDRDDAKLLLSQMHAPLDEVWAAIKAFLPTHQVDKASYALEDLWEALHGSR